MKKMSVHVIDHYHMLPGDQCFDLTYFTRCKIMSGLKLLRLLDTDPNS
jgi:hypothetical protein